MAITRTIIEGSKRRSPLPNGKRARTVAGGFADYLCALRDALGYNQQQLADEVGYSRSCIANIEMGIRMPSLRLLAILRHRYGLSVDAMVDAMSDPTQLSD